MTLTFQIGVAGIFIGFPRQGGSKKREGGPLLGGSSHLDPVVRITPIYKPWKGHFEGVPQPYLGDLVTIVINHVSKSWEPILQVVTPGFS